MKIFKSWKKSLALLVSILTVALIPVVAHATASWGPSRTTFDWNDPAHYANYVTFNSFTNNPSWGDERYVVKGRDMNAAPTSLATNVPVTDGETMSVVVYFHNNAGTSYNLKAQNTAVSIELPSGEAATQSVKASISASNSNPGTVWSTMDFTASQPFSLEYQPGSARLSNYVFTSGTALSDNVVNGGTLVGYDSLNGVVPGCSEYSGYVLIHVKVHYKQVPKPDYACTLLNVTADSTTPRKYNATVTPYAVNGATFSTAKFDWGEGTPTVTSGTTDTHTYPNADKSYTVVATLTFNVGDTKPTAVCSKTITVTSTPPPTTPPASTPPAATTLPNTGPGSVAAIFGGITAFAGMFHYLWSGRKQNQ